MSGSLTDNFNQATLYYRLFRIRTALRCRAHVSPSALIKPSRLFVYSTSRRETRHKHRDRGPIVGFAAAVQRKTRRVAVVGGSVSCFARSRQGLMEPGPGPRRVIPENGSVYVFVDIGSEGDWYSETRFFATNVSADRISDSDIALIVAPETRFSFFFFYTPHPTELAPTRKIDFGMSFCQTCAKKTRRCSVNRTWKYKLFFSNPTADDMRRFAFGSDPVRLSSGSLVRIAKVSVRGSCTTKGWTSATVMNTIILSDLATTNVV